MKKTLKILSVFFAIVILFTGCATGTIVDKTTKPVETTTQVVVNNDIISLAEDTKEDVNNGETLDTEEIIQSTPKEEEANEDELEIDGTKEIENISWDGVTAADKKAAKKLLGKYQGLTYYSQKDSRWGNTPYTSCGNNSQTIKNSGCGPTSAAMVISSSKGAIIPPTVAKLFVKNGFRTRNNGTAWSAWAFVADYFDFKDYHPTGTFDTMINYLSKDKNKDGQAIKYTIKMKPIENYTTEINNYNIVNTLIEEESDTVVPDDTPKPTPTPTSKTEQREIVKVPDTFKGVSYLNFILFCIFTPVGIVIILKNINQQKDN